MELLCAGGIYGLIGVVISIENSSVVGNTAATLGGGMHVETDSILHVTSTTVENNTAVYAGVSQPHISRLTDQSISFLESSRRGSTGILT